MSLHVTRVEVASSPCCALRIEEEIEEISPPAPEHGGTEGLTHFGSNPINAAAWGVKRPF